MANIPRTQAAIAVLALGVCQARPAGADCHETWPVLEGALRGPAFGEVTPIEGGDGSPLTLTRSGCPAIPIDTLQGFAVTVRFEPGRALRMELLVARLPAGVDAYKIIAAASKAPRTERFPDGCLLPKSGLSLLQVDRYWIAFPTSCKDIYPYKKSLPIVLEALRNFFGARFPSRFIYGPCGQLVPRLVDVGTYLSKAGVAAKPRGATDGE